MFMKWKISESSPMKGSRRREDVSTSRATETFASCSPIAKTAQTLAVVNEDGDESSPSPQSGDEAEKTMSQSQWLCSRLGASCQRLWENEMLLDCTVACSHGRVMAHKIVLSAASNYLLNLLHENQSDHPTLILDTSVDCLKHLMRFMYYGILPPEENEDFFELAAKLQLQGVNRPVNSVGSKEPSAEDQTSQPRRRGRPPTVGRPPVPPPPPRPPPAAETETPPPAPRRRRGRPRKTPQVTRREDSPPAEEAADGTVIELRPARPPPTEVNVKVVQTLAGTVEILEQPRAGLSGSSGALSPTRLGRSGLVATAGIPEQLFGGPVAAGRRQHGDEPSGDGPQPDPAADSDSDAADTAGGADLESESEPAWESVLGLDSSHEQSSFGQAPVAARISKTERPTRMTASSVQCGYCGKMCCNKETLKVHRRIHTDERPYTCPVAGCDKTFRQRIHLRRHALCHDVTAQLPKYPCHNCGRVFRHEVNLERHRENVEREGQPCSPPRPRAKGGQRFPCNLCGKKFVSQTAFNNHVRVHTNQRPFVCTVCDKGFKQKSHLTEHERIHSGQKPFKCAECDLTFYNRSRFKMHQVQHVNEALQMGKDPLLIDPKNKFPACPICFKRFINASNLRLHEQSHSNDKPHRCHLCNSRFKLARTLTKHLAAHASGAWATPRAMEGQRAAQQAEAEAGAAVSQVSVPLAETGEGVIILREEEDGSLTYVPGLQEADTDGRVVQVMLGDPEPTKEAADQLMSEESGLASKWVAASVQQMLPAGVEDSLPAADPAGPSRAAEGASSATTAQTVLMETEDVDGGGG